ncbi:hypothetical protein BDV23DRAFT_180865 [Aspergillus alliaceus]|uniref:Aminoglycoside phosphotransferase domain-containing protein n=1 Tax=Petromyces alliaceus TaxID=209559 RepID=A0A5N7CGS2_PETAA|nr:hypothetical protein BDV23DRAFT_180865 [Aspergillus alliaceus]
MASTFPNEQLEEQDVAEFTSSDSSECDEYALFSPVMERIRLDRLAKYVATTRKRIHPSDQNIHVVEIKTPIFGSYHVLYPVKFNDEALWLLKVPVNGTRENFKGIDSRTLRSEALTMRLLRRETTIPLPDVFAFSATCDNELDCPFILMSHMEGQSLYKVWFDRTSPKDVVQARRTRCLQGLAAAMVQLGKFSFSQGGLLDFDDDGLPLGMDPFRLVNNAAMLERSRDGYLDGSTIYLETGPFAKPKAYYTAILDSRREPNSTIETGLVILLRLFIDWITEPSDGQEAFILAHPDFEMQNVLVSEDGQLQSIIDWDGVSAVPRTLGNEAYPSWLMRDWNPLRYGWTGDMCVWEDSPDALRFYRSLYVGFIRRHRRQDDPACVNLTTRSLIHRNLLIAANDPPYMVNIVEKIFNAIVSLARGGMLPQSNVSDGGGDNRQEELNSDNSELEGFDLYNVASALNAKQLSEGQIKILRLGFDTLLQQSSTL